MTSSVHQGAGQPAHVSVAVLTRLIGSVAAGGAAAVLSALTGAAGASAAAMLSDLTGVLLHLRQARQSRSSVSQRCPSSLLA
jgi:hypothetical protein